MSITNTTPERKECIPVALPFAPYRALHTLNLSGQPLHTASAIGNLPCLTSLLLANCDLKAFPRSLFRCKKIEILSIRDNKITNLPKAIASWTHLTFIDTSGNPLSDKSRKFADLPITLNTSRDYLRSTRKLLLIAALQLQSTGHTRINTKGIFAGLQKQHDTLLALVPTAPKNTLPTLNTLLTDYATLLAKK